MYTAAGIGLFPCRSNKEPAISSSWKVVEPGQYTAEQLPNFMGVNLPAHIIVFDIDPKRFENGVDQFKLLLKKFAIPKPLDTFIVETPSGGRHVYMSCPPGRRYQMFLKEFPAIEAKSLGRYVIGAGSKGYKVLKGSLDRLMRAPEALLTYCEMEQRKTGEDIVDDSRANQLRFARFCEREAEPAIEHSGGDTRTFKTALTGRDYGLSEAVCFEIMLAKYNDRCVPKWSEKQLRKKVENAYEYGDNAAGTNAVSISVDELPESFVRKITGQSKDPLECRWDREFVRGEMTNKLTPSLINHVSFFLTDYGRSESEANPLKNMIGYNVVSKKVEFLKPAPWHRKGAGRLVWEDSDDTHLLYYLQFDLNYKNANIQKVMEAVTIVAEAYSFNPITDYLDSVSWDGVPRLDTWLTKYCHVEDNKYTRFVAKALFLAACARAYKPGTKYDQMIVFEGAQGIYKSTLIKVLGGDFYADIPLNVGGEIESRRTAMKFLGKWITECSEMTFVGRQQAEDVKSYLSLTHDTVVLPYARRACDIARGWIILGSYNPLGNNGYLVDPTGHRRFWPVLMNGKIQIDAIKEIRDQLFAEAVQRYKEGEKFHIEDPEIARIAKEEQSRREVTEEWTPVIEDFDIDPAKETLYGKSSNWIAEHVIGVLPERYNRGTANRIARAMRSLGYKSKQLGERVSRSHIWVK